MSHVHQRLGGAPASRRASINWILVGASLWFMSGCGVSMEPLMPTPVLFTESGLDPLDHIPASEQWIPRRVYYATNRARHQNRQNISYGNDPSDEVSVGLTLIGFGGPEMTWSELDRISTQSSREDVVELSLAGLVEAGRFRPEATPIEAAQPDQAGWLLKDFNDAVTDARDKDVLIYVHGAKVNFYNACAFAAQLDHFMGRDMTSIAFSWPTRQNIFAYVVGSDVTRAYDSATALASLIELLAAETEARRIHILSWSAGARLATKTFMVLRERHPDESEKALRQRYRIGTAYFAAGDVPMDEFLDALPTINALVDRVVVTVTSSDNALISSRKVMGGDERLGQSSKSLTDQQKALIVSQERLEVVDVSLGREDRGFDITGHRYWFNHPWASSDVLLAIRTDFTPIERGLVQGDDPMVWIMSPDYPQRLAESLRDVELRKWE
jgi:esterase/lipase superfamily enzyme